MLQSISSMLQLNINWSYLALLFLLLSPKGMCQDYAKTIQTLDAYIERARQQWEVPGLSVAIVKDGKVLLAKGYGLRSLNGTSSVDENTIFSIGSTTKAMVAAAMGMLVDEGKVSWDDKVIDHLPAFQLYDPYVTRELRIKDLFTHNAGLGNADLLWYYNDTESSDILHRMRLAVPAYPFRGGYTYQNIMYLAAGELLAKVSGKTWAEFMKERLFAPLGMSNTYSTLLNSQQQENRSIAHHWINKQITPIEDCSADAIAPAGAIWSSVADMSKWMQFMLDSGKVAEKPLLETGTYQELIKPQIIIPKEQFYPTTALTQPHWTTYGLGWFQHDYKGYALQFHSGSLPGTVAIIGLVPGLNLGVYVLGNLDHAEVRHAIMYQVIDAFLGDDDSDWSTDLKQLYDGISYKQEMESKAVFRARQLETQPSKSIGEYTGRYFSAMWGEVKVSEHEGQLKLWISSQLEAELEHWHFDTFNAKWSRQWMSDSLLSFQLNNTNGAVETLIIGNRSYQRIIE